MAIELGATEKVKGDKHILTGDHHASDIQKRVYAFISDFVLCQQCRNPETTLYVNEGNAYTQCRACGSVHSLIGSSKTKTKMINFILKSEREKPVTDQIKIEEDEDPFA